VTNVIGLLDFVTQDDHVDIFYHHLSPCKRYNIQAKLFLCDHKTTAQNCAVMNFYINFTFLQGLKVVVLKELSSPF
jgi:hypothetical protein